MSELIYPIFLECSKYTSDIFWKYIFEDLAYSKSPYGTYITKNFLCCNYKGKEFSYKIDTTKDAKLLFEEIYDLLYNKLGLLSDKDKLQKRQYFENSQKESHIIQTENWNSIKKKSIKTTMIENYVIHIKNKYNLSFCQSNKLLSLIVIGIIFKTITNEDIKYQDGEILSINGFQFENKKVILDKDIYDYDDPTISEVIIDKKLMSNNWYKYIQNLKK